jgi:thioredoxin reductase (NADPH)
MTNNQVLIIGSGPSGLTAAIYASRAGLNPILIAGSISQNLVPGGQLMITTEIENYPGFSSIAGPELMDLLFAQAKKFNTEIIEEFATEFEFKDEGYHRVLAGGKWYEAPAIILAMGARAKWLGLANEVKFRNKGISACATCDGPLPMYRDKVIYVVGGGDTACEEALFLSKFASKVYIVHRRDRLRASKIMATRVLQHEKIEILWNTDIVGYIGDERLSGLTLSRNGNRENVSCEALFMAIGHEPNTTPLQNTLVELDYMGYIKVRDNVFTNVDGVFAAGDCHDKAYRQAITASGFGCMASIACERWLSENV